MQSQQIKMHKKRPSLIQHQVWVPSDFKDEDIIKGYGNESLACDSGNICDFEYLRTFTISQFITRLSDHNLSEQFFSPSVLVYSSHLWSTFIMTMIRSGTREKQFHTLQKICENHNLEKQNIKL